MTLAPVVLITMSLLAIGPGARSAATAGPTPGPLSTRESRPESGPESEAASQSLRVALRPVVRDLPTGPVRLGDVADLAGPGALRLADLVVAPALEELPSATTGWAVLDAAAVRAALAALPDLHSGRVAFSGSRCEIQVAEPAAPSRPVSAEAAVATPPEARETTAPAEVGPPPPAPGTVGARIAGMLRETLAVREHDLRVGFEDRDADFLSEPVAGRAIGLELRGVGDRAAVAVTVYGDQRIEATRTVSATVSVRRVVSTLKRAVLRGETIVAEDVSTGPAWVSPRVDAASASSVVGAVAQRMLVAGAPVQRGDVAPPLAIARGDMVVVHSVAGSVAVRQQARALDDAREGDLLMLEPKGSRRRVQARASGRGEAVMVWVDGSPDAPGREGGDR